jgi:hypothetical protein
VQRSGGVVEHGVDEDFEVREAEGGRLGLVELVEGGDDDRREGLQT